MNTKYAIIHPAPGSKEARIIALLANDIKMFLAGKITINQHNRNTARIRRVWARIDTPAHQQADLFATEREG